MAIAEVYECDECGKRSDQGPDDGLPDDWGMNMDGDAFCAACLIRKPLDPHECDDDYCCPSARRAGGQEREAMLPAVRRLIAEGEALMAEHQASGR